MTNTIIDFAAYRRLGAAPTLPEPQELFIAQYAAGSGYVFGTIDAAGKRTIHSADLSLAEAIALITNPETTVAQLGM